MQRYCTIHIFEEVMTALWDVNTRTIIRRGPIQELEFQFFGHLCSRTLAMPIGAPWMRHEIEGTMTSAVDGDVRASGLMLVYPLLIGYEPAAPKPNRQTQSPVRARITTL